MFKTELDIFFVKFSVSSSIFSDALVLGQLFSLIIELHVPLVPEEMEKEPSNRENHCKAIPRCHRALPSMSRCSKNVSCFLRSYILAHSRGRIIPIVLNERQNKHRKKERKAHNFMY